MESVKQALQKELGAVLPVRAVQSIVSTLPPWTDNAVGSIDVVATQVLMKRVEQGIKLFGGAATPATLRTLRSRCSGGRALPPTQRLIPVKSDADVLVVQTTCQQLCTEFFGATDVVRLATAVSELARNIYMYAKRGEVELSVAEAADGVRFHIVARDQGPGIPHLEEVLSGRYTSRTGLGRGLVGTRTMLDGMEVETRAGVGTTVRGWKKVRAR